MPVQLDGKSQYLSRIDGLIPLGIGETWTLAFWAKPGASSEFGTIFSTGELEKNVIQVSTTAVPEEVYRIGKPPAELRVMIKDGDGTTIKKYGWGGHFEVGTWVHTAITWDGTDLLAFKDAVPTTTGVVLVNATGTMLDYPPRRICYGSAVRGDLATFSGVVGQCGIWNSLLVAEELDVVVSGGSDMELTAASGSYTSQANLQHYWKPGDDVIIGKDFTVVGTRIDLTLTHNVTANNVVGDQP